jgi:type I restriction enzyme S subunit
MSGENSELPAGWASTPLKDLIAQDGLFNDGDWVESKDQDPNGDVRLIQLADIGDGVFRDRSERFLTAAKAEELQCTFLRTGDVLISRLADPLGRACIFPEQPRPCIAAVDVCIFRSGSDGVDHTWLMHFINSIYFRNEIGLRSSGTTRTRISRKNLGDIEMRVPPLAEQRRIVAKIEALQERSRRAREALSEVGPVLEQFRQSVLAAAFRGDLTADWRAAHPNAEPTSELLHRIRVERRRRWEQAELAKYKANGQKPPQNWKAKYKEPEPVDNSDLPELPEGWCWTRLPELGYMNRGKSRHRPRNAPHLYGGPYPFVQTGDIAQSRGRIVSHMQTYSEAGLAQSQLWPEGTVCITIAANIASSAVLNYPACFPDSVVGLIPDKSLCSPEFVEFFIRTVRDDLERFAPSTAQKNINLETLTEVAVPLPPLEESNEITRLLTELIDGGFHVDQAVAGLIDQVDQLDQSILAKAFRGELVTQDPSNEPASVLLERIRAQREQQTEVTKKTSKTQRRNKMEKKSLGLASQRRPLTEVLAAKGQSMPPNSYSPRRAMTTTLSKISMWNCAKK